VHYTSLTHLLEKKKEIQFIFTLHITQNTHALGDAKHPFLRQLIHFFRQKPPLAEICCLNLRSEFIHFSLSTTVARDIIFFSPLNMDSRREEFIQNHFMRGRSSCQLRLLINNLADPTHPDYADTLHPNSWEKLEGRCVRCGVQVINHVIGGFFCNLLRAAELCFGTYVVPYVRRFSTGVNFFIFYRSKLL